MSVCMRVEHILQTIQFISFRLGMFIFNAPKKYSVEFCVNWKCDRLNINKKIIKQRFEVSGGQG